MAAPRWSSFLAKWTKSPTRRTSPMTASTAMIPTARINRIWTRIRTRILTRIRIRARSEVSLIYFKLTVQSISQFRFSKSIKKTKKKLVLRLIIQVYLDPPPKNFPLDSGQHRIELQDGRAQKVEFDNGQVNRLAIEQKA